MQIKLIHLLSIFSFNWLADDIDEREIVNLIYILLRNIWSINNPLLLNFNLKNT